MTETRIVRKRVQPDTKDVGFIEQDGDELLRVPISSTSEDRDGDEFSKEGLDRQLEQLESGTVKMFPDHGLDAHGMPVYRFSDIMGKWTGGELEGDTLFGFAKLREGDANAEELRDLIEQDMPVGFSVGFGVPEGSAEETNSGNVFNDADLMEVSAVGIESNPDAVVGAAVAKAVSQSDDPEKAIEGLTDAIKNMDKTETESTNEDVDTESKDDEEYDEEEKEEEDDDKEDYEDKEFSEDEVAEIMGAVTTVVESHMEALTNDIRDSLMDADMEEDSADTEETDGDHGDEDDEEEMSADVKALKEELEAERKEREELKAKVESLESKSRESSGKKGMVPAEKSEEPEDTESETKGQEAPEDFYANLA